MNVPPLRGRAEDIPVLAEHFLRQLNQKYGTRFTGLSCDAKDMLSRHSWPGNVRELRNLPEAGLTVSTLRAPN